MPTYIAKANRFFSEGKYSQAWATYELAIQEYPELSTCFQWNIETCKRLLARAPRSAQTAAQNITITLTTISHRLSLLPAVIESLHGQTLKPEQILLHISEKSYLLDEGIRRDDPRLSEIVRFPLVKIVWTENTGPFRKIVPFLQKVFDGEEAQEHLFVTVDDDTVYPKDFLESLYLNFIRHDCVVAFRGRYATISAEKIAPYADWELGRMEPAMNNVPTGKDGVLYSTKFFTREFLEMQKALELTPTADDLWIKWHCGLNGVKAIILNPQASTSDYKGFPVVDYSAAYRDMSLYKKHNSGEAKNGNDASVDRLERYFLDHYGYNLYRACSQ